jgi:ATP/maltotriose-dependent transcriptional regulator MalT
MTQSTEAQAAVTVLTTKLRRPSTPLLLVARPRLLEQLGAYEDRQLIEVGGLQALVFAGQGQEAAALEALGEAVDQLVLSPVTVKKHTQRIYRKLGVHNRREAVAKARRLGLV